MEANRLVGFAAVVITFTALLVNLIAVPMLINSANEIHQQIEEGIGTFKEMSDLAWAEIRLVRTDQLADSRRVLRQTDQNDSHDDNPCAPGEPGDTGTTGEDGEPGDDGVDGTPGRDADVNDDDDTHCFVCPAGPAGVNGLRGNRGKSGEKGDKGIAGLDGVDGWPGQEGPTGPAGDPGWPGTPGTKGLPGKPAPGGQGKPGPKGVTGPRGGPGPQGSRGDESFEVGPDGPAGKQGQQGLDGIPGTNGEIGPAGPAGYPGANANFCPCPFELLRSGAAVQTDGSTPVNEHLNLQSKLQSLPTRLPEPNATPPHQRLSQQLPSHNVRIPPPNQPSRPVEPITNDAGSHVNTRGDVGVQPSNNNLHEAPIAASSTVARPFPRAQPPVTSSAKPTPRVTTASPAPQRPTLTTVRRRTTAEWERPVTRWVPTTRDAPKVRYLTKRPRWRPELTREQFPEQPEDSDTNQQEGEEEDTPIRHQQTPHDVADRPEQLTPPPSLNQRPSVLNTDVRQHLAVSHTPAPQPPSPAPWRRVSAVGRNLAPPSSGPPAWNTFARPGMWFG